MSRFRSGQEVVARKTIETKVARIPMGQIGMVIAIETISEGLDAVRVKFRQIEPDLRVADSDLVELDSCRDSLVDKLVNNAFAAGVEAVTIMLIDLEERAKTSEAKRAVDEAGKAWLEFSRSINSALKVVRDQPKEKEW